MNYFNSVLPDMQEYSVAVAIRLNIEEAFNITIPAFLYEATIKKNNSGRTMSSYRSFFGTTVSTYHL